MQVILLLLWFLAGCIIAIPYTFLANGSFDSFLMTAWIAPAAALFLFIAYAMSGVGRRDSRHPKWGDGLFWAFVAYFCSPILLNGTSLLLKWAEYEVVGHYVFEGRFIGLLAVPMLLVVYGAIASGMMSIRQRFSGGATPSSGTPPSNGFGPNKITTIATREERKNDPGTFQLASA